MSYVHPTQAYVARVVAPHFVAGIEVDQGEIVSTAPILKYMVGWKGREVIAYCVRRGWDVRRL